MSADNSPQITLFRGFPVSNAHGWSPFAVKLEARLRFSKIPYKLDQGSPKTGPKGKIPYISLTRSSGQTESIGDSGLIIRHLMEEGIVEDLNADLTPFQRAQDLAIRALLEDRMYFYGTREKWTDNYQTMRDGSLAAIPWPLRIVVGYIAHSTMMRNLYGQGVGRLTNEEVQMLKEEGWSNVDAILREARKLSNGREGPFWILGGETPTEADTVMFGFVAGALICEAAPSTMKIVKSFPIVVEYANRIQHQYFPDYQKWD